MKIRFLGVGSAFTTAEYFQSNFLITTRNQKRLLFDCGGDIRFSLKESGISINSIDAVYISHLHNDHIGGMEWLAIGRYFVAQPRQPILLCEQNQIKRLWKHALQAGLECGDGRVFGLEDYFDCRPLEIEQPFFWDSLQGEMVKLPHVLSGEVEHPSFGLILQENQGLKIFISSDTLFRPDKILPIAQQVTAIFHDCETCPEPTGVHTRYEELCTLPAEVKAKMWLYHYQPAPPFDPVVDGFQGFVRKGQEFCWEPPT